MWFSRRRQRHQLAALAMALVPVRAASAALWQTEDQLTAQYGEPVEISRLIGERTFPYNSKGLTIEVQFNHGTAGMARYSHEHLAEPFSAAEVAALLQDNAAGKSVAACRTGEMEPKFATDS